MNSKKFVSSISAFAIAASAFAGLAVTASAGTKTLYSQDFENVELSELSYSLAGNTTARIQTNAAGNATSFFNYYTSGASGDRASTLSLGGSYAAEKAVQFSMLMRMMGSNTTGSAFEVRDSSGAAVFNFATAGSYVATPTINGTDVTLTTAKLGNTDLGASDYAATGWLKFDAAIDFTVSPATVNLTVTDTTNSNAIVYSAETTTTATNISTIYGNIGRSNGAFAYDNILITEEVDTTGYQLTTTPYSTIVIDGTTTVNSGNSGVYTFEPGTTGTKNVVISKNGYATRTETIEVADDTTGTYTLTPNDGYSYYEDFSNVTDGNFGFSNGVTVADGVLSFEVTSGNDASTTIPSVNVAGKAIHIVTKALNASANHYGYIKLDGTDLSLYYYGSQIRLHGASNGKTSFITDASNATTIDIVVSSANTGATLYVNGVSTGEYVSTTSKTLTGLSTAWGKGTFKCTIDELAVTNAATYNVTVVDDTASSTTNYISGTEVTLPEAAGKEGYEFKGWSDGTNTVAAGTVVTVSADVTYTAVYEAEAPATESKAFTFASPLSELSSKTLKVSVTYNGETKDGSKALADLTPVVSGEGDASVAVVITGVPEGAVVTTVIE